MKNVLYTDINYSLRYSLGHFYNRGARVPKPYITYNALTECVNVTIYYPTQANQDR